ncbi:MAG: Mur ligase domain-containing protein [Candidatus Paceibacterota bacterium]
MKPNNTKKVHFIGIGGIGISALARHYLHEGFVVQGSDSNKTSNSEKLEAVGVKVFYEQTSAHIKDDIDLIIYSDGVTEKTAGWSGTAAARASGYQNNELL